jgi:DNA-binding beta-propeller fold protein YncE
MPRIARRRALAAALFGLAAAVLWLAPPADHGLAPASAITTPQFAVDPGWPKPLPNNWILGQVAGVAVDARDHIWIIQRPSTLTPDEKGAALSPPRSKCCLPAPPVMEFDAEGNFIQGWGGTGAGYEWPAGEHGIHIDHKDNVWIAGNGENDHQVLKFTRAGKFLMQIGRAGMTNGSNDISFLGRPADTEVDAEANEVYVADGYRNKRVIVFDADTGVYKRHWGAYGNRPSDDNAGAYNPTASVPQQFRSPVHCVRIAKDGLVYVCDRVNNRIQVFLKDGTFVREFTVAKETLGNGAVWDLDFLPDKGETYMVNADGENNHVWVLLRRSGEVVSIIGQNGRSAGQFHWIHNLAVDSKGNIYTAEVDTGKRAQKFRLVTQLGGL